MVLPNEGNNSNDARLELVTSSSQSQDQVEVEMTGHAGNRDVPILDISRKCGKAAIDDKVQVSLSDVCRKAFPADPQATCVFVDRRFESERNPADKEKFCRYDQNVQWGVPKPNTLVVAYHLEAHPDCVKETDGSFTGPESSLKLRIFVTVKKREP